MRFVIAAVILAVALPGFAEADSPKSACKSRAASMYKFCMINARTKQMKQSCKADRKHNKGQCK
jgi:hypothetical protein